MDDNLRKGGEDIGSIEFEPGGAENKDPTQKEVEKLKDIGQKAGEGSTTKDPVDRTIGNQPGLDPVYDDPADKKKAG